MLGKKKKKQNKSKVINGKRLAMIRGQKTKEQHKDDQDTRLRLKNIAQNL